MSQPSSLLTEIKDQTCKTAELNFVIEKPNGVHFCILLPELYRLASATEPYCVTCSRDDPKSIGTEFTKHHRI